MARKLNANLKKELISGKYAKLLKAIRQDPELTLEIRTGGKAHIYHHKKLILTLAAKSEPKLLSDGYIKEGCIKPQLDLCHPEKYLNEAKEIVRSHSKKMEFAIQQNIANSNKVAECDYFVVDMEYAFPQNDIIKEERISKTRIDLVAIEKGTNDIVLFELKYGATALSGTSGVDGHFEKTMRSIDNVKFRDTIKADIKNIIEDKNDLKIIEYKMPTSFNKIRMMYIYAYNNDNDYNAYRKKYESAYKAKGINTLYIDTRYKLKCE